MFLYIDSYSLGQAHLDGTSVHHHVALTLDDPAGNVVFQKHTMFVECWLLVNSSAVSFLIILLFWFTTLPEFESLVDLCISLENRWLQTKSV